MRMYKVLIIFIALLFTLAGGYYISTAGGGVMADVITGDVTSSESLRPINEEDMVGTFACLNSSTCKNPYTLVLHSDKSVFLFKVEPEKLEENVPYEDQDIGVYEKGEWSIGVKNMLVINLTSSNQEEYGVPQKIVINNVTSKILSKISYTKTRYKDMHNPIFAKVSE